MTGIFSSVRNASLAVLAAALLATMAAPSTALADNGKHLGWQKNGKAAEKQRRKAERQAQKSGRVVVVDGNDRNNRTIDRSSVRRDQNNKVYRDRNGNTVYDYRNSRVDPYAQYPQYRRNPYNSRYPNNGYYNTYPNYNGGYYGNNYPYSNSGGYYGNNYPYSNSGGYYGGYPNYSNREGDIDRSEVAQRAAQNGYYAGFERGQYDAQRGNRPNPQGHGAFQHGFDGFNPEWGSASTYQQSYRSSFVQGYNDGYSRRGYSNRFPRRRF
jgi:hypothetical protein